MEKELLEKRNFNTNVGNEIEKDEMLRKVWAAGSQKFLANRRKQEIQSKRFFVGLDSTTSSSTNQRAAAPRSAQPATRPRTSVSIASPSFIKRPFTAIEPHLRKATKNLDLDQTDDDDVFAEDAVSVAATSRDVKSDDVKDGHNIEVKSSLLQRPKTMPHKPMSTRETSHKVAVTSPPRDKAKPATTTTESAAAPVQVPAPAGFFNEEKKPTLLDIHMQHMRSANFDDKIKKFGDSISGMCSTAPTHGLGDYYTLRLQTESATHAAQKIVSFGHLATGGVPADEFRRWAGNTALKSITVKTLDLDFANRPSSYYHECLN